MESFLEQITEWLGPVTVTKVSATVASILACYYLWPTIHPRLSHIPGPRPLPILGTMWTYLKYGFGKTDIAMIKKYGKIFRVYEGRTPLLVVADTRIIKQILLKQFSKFTQRRPLPLRGIFKWSILDAKDEAWRRQRHLLTPSFTTGRLKDMLPVVVRCANNLCNILEETAESGVDIDIKRNAGAFSMDVIAGTGFGLDLDSQSNPDNQFAINARKVFSASLANPAFLAMFFAPFTVPLLEMLGVEMIPKDPVAFFRRLMEQLIDERQQRGKAGTDFLQMMVDAHNMKLDEEGIQDLQGQEQEGQIKGFSRDEIIAQSLLFFLAGYDTTANTLAFLLYELSQNQHLQDKLYQEIQQNTKDLKERNSEVLSKMTYLDQCVQETLRKYPAGVRLDRTAQCDVQIDDLFIPAGTTVMVPVHALHNDETVWPNPDLFDPSRFDPEMKASKDAFSYLPFGMGPRQCIGMRLAQLEIKIACIQLLKRYTLLPSQIPLEVVSLFFTQTKNGAWLKLSKRGT